MIRLVLSLLFAVIVVSWVLSWMRDNRQDQRRMREFRARKGIAKIHRDD